ncbi:MAG: formate dehydrogenase [Rhodopseudomonas sp.]|nr:formate dehydrogenase [Rhodopseudomonas sp.]
MSSPQKLVYMANQIGKFFVTQGRGRDQDQSKAAAGIAEHIGKFWEPRMRNAIFAHLDAGGAGLDPAVRTAIEQLKAKSVAA